MKPRNVVEFSYSVKTDAVQFFNDVEKYINLMITDLQENVYLIVIAKRLLMIFVLKLNL